MTESHKNIQSVPIPMFLSPPTKRPTKNISKDKISNADQKSGWSCDGKTHGLLSSPLLRLKRRIFTLPNWHEEIKKAADTQNWEEMRRCIGRVHQMSGNDSSGKDTEFGNSKSSLGSYLSVDSSQSLGNRLNDTKTTFWTRLVKGRAPKPDNGYGLLGTDDESRTPLHLLLKLCKDQSIILNIINLEPGAAAKATSKGRLPLHFAVVHRHDWPIIATLIDAYPAGLSTLDSKKQSPLHYAMNIAARESTKTIPPRTYWMPISGEDDEDHSYDDPLVEEVVLWQEEQIERWATVHWLLLSSATHPQSSLSVEGRQKPMLVEALLSAAPPAVVSLLIGASVMNLPLENKVTVFAASTLYTCITRQYPLAILQSLASQLHVLVRGSSKKIDMRALRDETGMGLVSAQYISCCFVQPNYGQAHEWTLSEEFYDALNECIAEGKIIDENPALLDWWAKMEFLVSFCWVSSSSYYCRRRTKGRVKEENLDPSVHPKNQLLHAALSNSDTPPIVIKILLSFYPSSVNEPDMKTGALPVHVACMNRDYIPRYFEKESNAMFSSEPTRSSLEIVLNAGPTIARKRFKGRTALHLAIASGKHYDAIFPLLSIEGAYHDGTSQLRYRDPKTFLFPFQLAAAYPNKSDEDSFRWTCIARNKFSYAVWQGKSDREKASEILKVAEGEELCRVDTIFRLLRLLPVVIRPEQLDMGTRIATRPIRQQLANAEKPHIGQGNIGIIRNFNDNGRKERSYGSYQSTDSSSTTDDSSFIKASKQPSSPTKKVKPTSLTLLLSKGNKVSQRKDHFLDCDASVLSSVDVLSTLTSTLHTDKAESKTTNEANDNSMTIQSLNSDDETDSDDSTSFDGFAEDSGIKSLSVTDFLEDDMPNKTNSENGSSSVSFEIRRKPRKTKGNSDFKPSTFSKTSNVTPDRKSENNSHSIIEPNGLTEHQRMDTTLENRYKTESIDFDGYCEMGIQAVKSVSGSTALDKIKSENKLLGSFSAASESEGLQFDVFETALQPNQKLVSSTNSNVASKPSLTFDKIKSENKLLGSFSAASESEGLTFDVFETALQPNQKLVSSTGSNVASKPSMTFDKRQMKWVESSTASSSRRTDEKKPSERPGCRSPHVFGLQPTPFVSRPPQKRKSKNMLKRGPTRQLASCKVCHQGVAEILMIPCKHLCICRRCSQTRAFIEECPVCFSAVTDRMILLG